MSRLKTGAVACIRMLGMVAVFWWCCWHEPAIAGEKDFSQGEMLMKQARQDCRDGRFPNAEAAYFKAINIFQQRDNSGYEGSAWYLLGECYLKQNRLLKALSSYETAKDLFAQKTITARAHLASALRGIGKVRSEQSEHLQAIVFFRYALRVLRHSSGTPSPQDEGRTLRDLGTALMRIGHYDDALKVVRQAKEIFLAQKAEKDYALTLIRLGSIYEAAGERELEFEGRKERALTHFFLSIHLYNKALERLKNIDLPAEKGTIFNNWGKTLQRLGGAIGKTSYYAEALELYAQAREAYHAAERGNFAAKAWNNSGEALFALSLHEEDRTDNLQSALDALLKAEKLQRKPPEDRSRLWITLSNLGRVYDSLEMPERALESYREAIAIFEELIDSSPEQAFSISLREQIASTYQAVVLLLWELGRYKEAFSFSEGARARAFLDQVNFNRQDLSISLGWEALEKLEKELEILERDYRDELSRPSPERDADRLARLLEEIDTKMAEYNTAFRWNGLEAASLEQRLSTRPLTLPELQQKLDRETTLLSFFVTPAKTLAFLITRQDFNAVELLIREWELRDLITGSRKIPRIKTDSPPEALTVLYDRLLAPLHDKIGTPMLGIVPHGILHSLPFSALTPDGRRYFGGERILYLLPSAGMATLLPKRKIPRNASLLALAFSGSEEFRLPPLSFVDDEVDAISSQYNSVVFQGEEASVSNFERLAARHDILHLAAHGVVDLENPLFSSIILNDGGISVGKVSRLKLPRTALVVLSACNTNVGKRSRGDDIVGLTRAFTSSGAPSILASLWPVNDRATAEFMEYFYKQLKRRKRPAEALQIAQQKTRKAYPHPYYWAGFVLAGAPGEIPEAVSAIEWLLALSAAAGIVLLLRTMKNYRH